MFSGMTGGMEVKGFIIILAIGLFLIPASSLYAQSGSITVEVSGINAIEGQVSIGLYTDETSFPVRGKVFMGANVKVTGNALTYTFGDVPLGTYAIAISHDSNSNGKLDKNFIGIPTEGYAFSNNRFGIFGKPPEFKDASFELTGDKTIRITIKY